MAALRMSYFFVIVLVAVTASVQAVEKGRGSTPTHIAECYTNATMLDRYNRPGMSMDRLIFMLRKIENHPEMKMRDMQEILNGVINMYKYDGLFVERKDGNIFVMVDGKENAKSNLLNKMSQDSYQTIPDDIFNLEETCGMHWMISHVVNSTRREEEEKDYYNRYRRDTKRPLLSRKARQMPTGTGEEKKSSRYPVEQGVVYTRYGTVSAGNVLQGILFGLQLTNKKIKDLIGSNSYPNNINELQVTSSWAATLAGEIAQTAIVFRVADDKVGPGGEWNNTMCPSEFVLTNNATALTDAEINGAIDGLLMALKIKDWDRTGRKVSQLLSMYYSEEGVVYEPKYRACDRKNNYFDIIDKDDLKKQSIAFAYAYQETVSDVPIGGGGTNGTESDIEVVIKQLEDRLGSINIPRCDEDVPDDDDDDEAKTYRDLSDVSIDMATDLHILVDMDISSLNEREEVKEILAGITSKLGNGSRVALYIGESMEVRTIYQLKGNDDLSCISCNILDLDIEQHSEMDFHGALEEMNEIFVSQEKWEDKENVRSTNTKVLLILSPRTEFDDSTSNEDRWSDFLDFHPYVQLLTIGDNSWESLVDSDDSFSFSSSPSSISSSVVERLQELPRRLLDPKCSDDDYDENESKDIAELYLTPGHVQYYELNAAYFHASQEFEVKVTSKDGPVTVCVSRDDVHPNVNGDKDCDEIGSSGDRDKTYKYEDACEDLDKNEAARHCKPIYFSFEASQGSSSSSDICKDVQCTRPDQLTVEVYLEDTVCGACGLLASPFTWLLALALAFYNRF